MQVHYSTQQQFLSESANGFTCVVLFSYLIYFSHKHTIYKIVFKNV